MVDGGLCSQYRRSLPAEEAQDTSPGSSQNDGPVTAQTCGLADLGPQPCNRIAEPLSEGELSKRHTRKPVKAADLRSPAVSSVACCASIEIAPRQVFRRLREDDPSRMHWLLLSSQCSERGLIRDRADVLSKDEDDRQSLSPVQPWGLGSEMPLFNGLLLFVIVQP